MAGAAGPVVNEIVTARPSGLQVQLPAAGLYHLAHKALQALSSYKRP